MDKDKQEQLNNLRHSAAHLLAAAVLELYPGTHNAIGPAIENGFYQDFDFGNHKITEEDLPKIEKKMRELLEQWNGFQIYEVQVEKARQDFAHNPYKAELIEDFAKEGKTITETKQGDFLDLCKGGHLENPKELQYFKLLSIAGAYWKGSEKNKMLTRIYGTAFPSQKELDDYLNILEEAKKRDHKKLGPQLDLFMFHETSPGMAYWLPKGLILYNILYDFTRKMYQKHGYMEVATPILNKSALYETSGHWLHYKDDMFISDMGENEMFGVKPMNCPNAMVIFGSKLRSYNDLPLRLAETTLLHRFELSGTLNGLFRIREFRQDDAHIFITIDQIKDEFSEIMKMIDEMYTPFNLSYRLRFGTRPDKYLGEAEDWDNAEKALKEVLDLSEEEYFEASGEGAFYGPKVDILMRDTLGREWQTGTIQLDFQQPKRFGLKYIDQEGHEKLPVVFHRAIYGSFERFLGILIEHYIGAFPTWLAPLQVMVIPITDRNNNYADKIIDELKKNDIRVEIDSRSERMQAKIRDAQLQKIPYMLIIGDKEENDDKVAVRTRESQDLGAMSIGEFISQIITKIESKS